MNRVRGRPFEPGNKLGRGRPKGSRNKSKSTGQDLFDEYAEHLTRKAISLGLAGDKSVAAVHGTHQSGAPGHDDPDESAGDP